MPAIFFIYLLPYSFVLSFRFSPGVATALVFLTSGVLIPIAVSFLANLTHPVINDKRTWVLSAIPILLAYFCVPSGWFFLLGFLGSMPAASSQNFGPAMINLGLVSLPFDILAALMVAGSGWLGSVMRRSL